MAEAHSAFEIRFPLRFRSNSDELSRRGRGDPAFLGQALEHLAVALAGVAPDDRPHGGVGLHGGSIDADPLALDQAVLGEALQHPGEDRFVHLERQPRASPAQPGMIRHGLGRAEAAGSP